MGRDEVGFKEDAGEASKSCERSKMKDEEEEEDPGVVRSANHDLWLAVKRRM